MKNLTLSLKTLLIVDGLSAYCSAGLTLVLASYLSELLQLHSMLLQVFSIVTIVYGSVALLLMNQSPGHWASKVFVFANWTWVLGVLLLLVLNYANTNIMGVSFLLSQALFVIGLTTMQMKKLEARD